MDNTELITRIEIRLKELGKTKGEFYKESGISSASYSQWNTGDFSPSKRKLKAASDCLGVSIEYLLNGEENPETKKEKPTDQEDGGNIGPAKRELLDMVDGMNEKESAAILEVVKATIKMRDAKE